MALVSFAADIAPLFRPVDIAHMKVHGVDLDDYKYMSDPSNAQAVEKTVAPQGNQPPSMPPDGPYWTQDQLTLFAKWRADGYQP